MSTVFDPDAFLQSTTTEAATKRPPLPAGMDFIATIKELKFRSSQGKKDPTKTYTFMDVTFLVQVPMALQEELGGLAEVQLTHGVGVDTLNAGLDWSPGKNSQLRRYREALGLNTAGELFSPSMLIGRQIRVKIKHRFYEGETFDEVDQVAKV